MGANSASRPLPEQGRKDFFIQTCRKLSIAFWNLSGSRATRDKCATVTVLAPLTPKSPG